MVGFATVVWRQPKSEMPWSAITIHQYASVHVSTYWSQWSYEMHNSFWCRWGRRYGGLYQQEICKTVAMDCEKVFVKQRQWPRQAENITMKGTRSSGQHSPHVLAFANIRTVYLDTCMTWACNVYIYIYIYIYIYPSHVFFNWTCGCVKYVAHVVTCVHIVI